MEFQSFGKIVLADGWKIKKFEKICVKHQNIESSDPVGL